MDVGIEDMYVGVAQKRGQYDLRNSHANADEIFDLDGDGFIDDAELRLRQDLSAMKACWYGDPYEVAAAQRICMHSVYWLLTLDPMAGPLDFPEPDASVFGLFQQPPAAHHCTR